MSVSVRNKGLCMLTLSCSVIAGTLITSRADSTPATPPQKRPTHEEIVKKKEEQAKEAPVLEPASDKDSTAAKKRSLIANSTILSSGEYCTLVPRGSVIHIPKHLTKKITTKPSGKLVDWKTFLRKNHGWLHVHHVKMAHAQGKDSIKPDVVKAYQSIGKIVVATCSGGPISVPISSLAKKQSK